MKNLKKIPNMNLRVLLLALWIASPEVTADRLELRQLDADVVQAGQVLYEARCAACHGKAGVGPKGDWRKRDAAGKLLPPPLNGSAHTWHHSTDQLLDMIRKGGVAYGSNMPAWEGVLSDSEIHSILAYVKSLWPDKVYNIWLEQWGER